MKFTEALKFTETRSMTASKLRNICIRNNWYTLGDNQEYSKLFDKLYDCCGFPENLTTEKLAEIAMDIWNHSEITEYTIESVLCELARNCYSCFDVKD